jgi:integrase
VLCIPAPDHGDGCLDVRSGRLRPVGPAAPLGLPQLAVQALRALLEAQAGERLAAGDAGRTPAWCSPPTSTSRWTRATSGRCSKRVCEAAGAGNGWTPRELRTSFVSLLSHRGVSIEEIARLAGHASTRTTEVVYRRELRPVITTGAEIMNELFAGS